MGSPERTGFAARSGMGLMVGSVLAWVPLPVLPFLSMTAGEKAAWAGGLVVVAEAMFWIGAVLAGPEAARRVRSWWRRKPSPEPEAD